MIFVNPVISVQPVMFEIQLSHQISFYSGILMNATTSVVALLLYLARCFGSSASADPSSGRTPPPRIIPINIYPMKVTSERPRPALVTERPSNKEVFIIREEKSGRTPPPRIIPNNTYPMKVTSKRPRPALVTERPINKEVFIIREEKSKKDIPIILSLGIIMSNVGICMFCITLNGLIISFYRKSLKKVVPFLYFANSLIDFCIGFGIVLQSCALIPTITEVTYVAGYLAVVSYVIVGVSVRISTFVNLVLCVVRAINIVNPFYHVNKKIIAMATAICAVLWLAIAIFDVVRFISNIGLDSGLYVLKSFIFKPEVGYSALRLATSNSFTVGEDLVALFVPAFVVPVVILIASTILQVYAQK